MGARPRDYENEGTEVNNAMYPMRGLGPFLHNDPVDRPQEIFGGRNTLHFTAGKEPYVLLPIIPAGD